MAISAIGKGGKITAFSSTGPAVTMAAPGVSIPVLSLNGTHAIGSGTSFATPHVSGAAALVNTVTPFMSAEEIKNILISTASGDGKRIDDNIGFGNLDLFAALRKAGAELRVPVFQLSRDEINFGDVQVGDVRTERIIVTNAGTAPLVIKEVSVFDNNEEFFVSADRRTGTIPVGESWDYDIKFVPNSEGEKNAVIQFVTDALSSPDTVKVTGNGFAVARFEISDTNMDFGDVPVGQQNTEMVTISNVGQADLNIDSATSTNPNFTVNPSNKTVEPANQETFSITFAPTEPGTFDSHVIFSHNGPSSPDTLSASGRGIVAIFEISSTNIHFGDVPVGQQETETVTISDAGEANLKIDSATSTNPNFAVNPTSKTVEPAKQETFNITFAPTEPGTLDNHIIFSHNGLNSPDTLTVSGRGIVARFEISTVEISFGNVVVGEQRTEVITISNAGEANLKIDSITSTDSNFAVDPNNKTVEPTKEETFDITFAPTQPENFEAYLIFSHNAPNSPDTISVNGQGIPKDFALFQNFPNPFNAETKIPYDLPKSTRVKLEIFNMLGQKIRTLV